jgi:hypothetical protein
MRAGTSFDQRSWTLDSIVVFMPYPAIARPVSREEYEAAVAIAEALQLRTARPIGAVDQSS